MAKTASHGARPNVLLWPTPQAAASKMEPSRLHRTRGVVPRACEEVLAAVACRTAQGIECELAVSYVEIYNNEVRDLLREGQ